MRDADRVLLNDWALVKVGRDVMGRGTDQLYAALIGLLVGISTLEAWQKE